MKLAEVDEEVGVLGGECYVSMGEFEDNEFIDDDCMKYYLKDAYEEYRNKVKEIEAQKEHDKLYCPLDGDETKNRSLVMIIHKNKQNGGFIK